MKKCGLWWMLLASAACSNDDPLRSDVRTPANPSEVDASVADARAPTQSSSLRDATVAARPEAAAPAVCERFEIKSGRIAPDMLIVLDRSGSMKTGDVNRWDPSVRAITTFTAALDDTINFGLMAFPGTAGVVGGGGKVCAAGELEVPIALDNGAAIATKLAALKLVDSTPTAPTLDAARKVLKDLQIIGDLTAHGAPYVVLVTDGAPNCSVDNGQGAGPSGFDQTAFEDSVAAIEAMAADGIKTYVLGYDGSRDAQLEMSLDAMAVAGATGDRAHRSIENEAELVSAFEAIAGSVVSCDFELEQAPADASYVLVKVGGKVVRYADANGWTLSADKKTLTLQGSACAELEQLEGTSLSVEVECTVVSYF